MKRVKLRELLPEDELRKLYIEQDMTLKEIADLKGCSAQGVLKMNRIYGIESRKGMSAKGRISKREKTLGKPHPRKPCSEESKRKMSLAKKGKFKKPSKYGGHTVRHPKGYVLVFVPDHPYASKDGRVMEHRLVMEEHIGRYLTKDEQVHHINRICDDNRIENLMLMTTHDHRSLHCKELNDLGMMRRHTVPVINVTTGEIFQSVKEAAESCGTTSRLISRVCVHKRKHTRGYEFKYLDEYNKERNNENV